MKHPSTIQKYFAFVMLLIFSFSITPKKYLHDLVADHTDFYSFHSSEGTSFNQSGFDCHCEDLVVSTPFIDTSFELAIPTVVFQKEASSSVYHFYFFNQSKAKDSRGPPSIA